MAKGRLFHPGFIYFWALGSYKGPEVSFSWFPRDTIYLQRFKAKVNPKVIIFFPESFHKFSGSGCQMLSFQSLIHSLKARNITLGEYSRRHNFKVLQTASPVPFRQISFTYETCQSLAVWPWANCLLSLKCSLFICTQAILPDLQRCWEDKWKAVWKVPQA